MQGNLWNKDKWQNTSKSLPKFKYYAWIALLIMWIHGVRGATCTLLWLNGLKLKTNTEDQCATWWMQNQYHVVVKFRPIHIHTYIRKNKRKLQGYEMNWKSSSILDQHLVFFSVMETWIWQRIMVVWFRDKNRICGNFHSIKTRQIQHEPF